MILKYILVDCTWGSWQSWYDCSETCGDGKTIRTRSKIVPESNGGICIGESVQHLACNQGPCSGKFNLQKRILSRI